jgi:hypothetical protein
MMEKQIPSLRLFLGLAGIVGGLNLHNYEIPLEFQFRNAMLPIRPKSKASI